MEIILDIGKEVVNSSCLNFSFIPFVLISMVLPMILIFVFDKETDGSGFGFIGRLIFKIFGRENEK